MEVQILPGAPMTIDDIVQQIGERAPHYAPYLHRIDSIYDLSRELVSVHPNPEYIRRQQFYKELILRRIQCIFTTAEQERIRLFTRAGMIANTANHLGVLNHPTLIAAFFVA